MKLIENIEEIEGKTIEKVFFNDEEEIYLTFSDNTRIVFHAVDYMSGEPDIIICKKNDLPNWDLVRLGLMSKEKYLEIEKKKAKNKV